MFEGLKAWWQRTSSSFGTAPSGNGRATPGSRWEPGNGVSSFHLWWQGLEGAAPLVEVAATIEVLRPPTASRLYFWALQASFLDGGRSYGAAHIGLQWNPRHLGNAAVNWGGYADTGNVQSILRGSPSSRPGARMVGRRTRRSAVEPHAAGRRARQG